MPLSRGARLGPYRIDAELGAGGMGEVFRATDTRLDRAVAIKVLPAGRWAEPELRHRFEREARALSSLNHPNLCALYDVGELTFKGLAAPYLVMELLEGESLRQRIDTAKSLPVRKSLQWAAQIANGLAAAHQKGVIHRDLKPENVFVVSGELLKILDFGLARDANTSDSAATHMRTQTGMVMGTAEYMSPEQARGATVGPQSDIFSLGIVLYEMLTGRTPFHKGSSVETMHAVLVDEVPEMAASGFNIPEHVEALVRRCLEKDPAQRFSSANDLAFALENAARSVTTTTQSTRRRLSAAARGVVSRTRVAVLLGALATVGAAFVLTPRLRHEPSPEPPRLRTLTYSGRDGAPAASRDGRFLAFVSTRDGTRRVWVKQLSDGTEAALTAGPDDTAPRFSPDGSRILFTRVENGGSAIYQVAVVGGEPRKLIENGFDGDWSPDGTRIAFLRNRSEETRLATLCVARVDGGTVQELAAEAQYEMAAPRWSPNGRWIAVTRNPRANASGSLLLVDPESKETKTLAREERHGLLSGVAWTPDGRSVVYAELEALNSTGLAEKRGSSAVVQQNIASGDARILLRNPHSAADTVDILASGGLVFSEDMTRQNLQEIWLDGSHAPRWITRGMSVDRQPAWARDGRSVVFTSDRGGNVDLWELTLDIGTLRRITDHERIDWDPHPARNGGALYWSSDRGGHFEVWTASLEGVGAHQVTRDGIEAQNPSLPFDAQWVYYDSTNPKADGLWRVPAAGGEATIVVAAETIHPEVSHDGEYVVYQRPETGGSMALDVVRVRDGSVYTLASGISGMGTLRARWIGSGHTVAFRAAGEDGRPALFSQEFIPDANTRGSRRQLTPVDFDNSLETYAVSPDGRRAILSVVDEASAIMVAEGVVW